MKTLSMKLRGYYNYYGVIGNYESLNEFFRNALRILKKWINRRSQKHKYNWKRFRMMLEHHRIEKPRITEKLEYQLSLQYSF
jgi:SOS response regulatory protein OraA/RecX